MTKERAMQIQETKRNINFLTRMINEEIQESVYTKYCYPKMDYGDGGRSGSGPRDSAQERIVMQMEKRTDKLTMELERKCREYNALLDELDLFCQELTAEQAMIITCRYARGKTVRQTASYLGVSESKVKQELSQIWKTAEDHAKNARGKLC